MDKFELDSHRTFRHHLGPKMLSGFRVEPSKSADPRTVLQNTQTDLMRLFAKERHILRRGIRLEMICSMCD